jgi:hypothetical protein
MKKVVKLNQKDIEKIVNNVINENQGELDEYLMLGNDKSIGIKKVYAGKDNEGNFYILDAETGKILAKDNPNKNVADDNLPMAAE